MILYKYTHIVFNDSERRMPNEKGEEVFAAISAMAMLMTAVSIVPAEETDPFLIEIQAAYAEPEMQYRPYARWWLAELYDAGYGGVEFVTLDESQYLDDATYAWGSPEWIHDTHVIIEECQKLGMSVSMTSGTHWATANLVSITPDEEAASQELGYVTLSLEGNDDGTPTSYKGYLPQISLPGKVEKSTLVKVISAVVTERGSEKSEKMAMGATITPSKIDISTVTDITDSVILGSQEGVYGIDYTAPDNKDYEIFAFYQYGTGESYRPAISESYTINYLSTAGAEALIDYWDTNVLTDDVQALIDQIDECDLYMDSLELSVHGSQTTGQLWCTDMLE